jgi:hypothetical protein
MPSESFLRRNPHYREAEWKSRGPREKRSNVRVVSNLDTFYAKQAGASSERGSGGEAFEGDSSAEGVARRLAETGRRTGFGGVGIEPNRNLSPRERRQLGLDKRQPSAPTGPTDDQRKWAQKFRESSTPSKPLAPTVQDKAGFNPMSPGAEDVPANTSTTAPEKPLNFSRSALVEGAKKSGDFAEIRKGFNTQSKQAGTGMRMNNLGVATPISKTKVGADGLTDYAREKFGPAVEDIRAKRDFATNKSTTTSGTAGLSSGINGPNADEMTPDTGGGRPMQASNFRREITSKYGTGSNVTRTPGQGGGTMVDPLTGKSVPTTGALADQSAVQTTKEPGSKTGDDYFDPKKFRQNRGRSA